MKGHLLCGEERVTVAWRDDGSSVDVEIVSLSKPAPGLAAKFVWPFAKKMQPIFFQEQLKALQNVAKQATIHNQHGPTPLKWQNLDNGRPVLPGIQPHQVGGQLHQQSTSRLFLYRGKTRFREETLRTSRDQHMRYNIT